MATFEPFPVLDRNSAFGRGGFGELYPDPRDSSKCIKKLHEPFRGEQARSMARLVDVVRWAAPSDAALLTTRFAWPLELFGTAGSNPEVLGFTMPLAPRSTRFALTAAKRTTEVDFQAKYLMDAQYWASPVVSTPKPIPGTEGRVEILIDLAACLEVLHVNGLTYGDVSSNNVAIRAEAVPGVFLFDADSILTVSERTKSPLHTPGWEVSIDDDPLGIDRARYALFALRVFLEDQNARPTPSSLAALTAVVGKDVAAALEAAYERGDAHAFGDLVDSLRLQRSTDMAKHAFDEALRSGHARRLLREALHATSAADRRMVDLASSQLAFETAVRGLAGAKRRKAIKRDRLQRSGFVLDVPPVISLPNPPKSAEELQDLIYSAMFEEVASHLVFEGLGPLESHSWLDRAVQHALIEGGKPEMQIRDEPGLATIRCWWPVDPFINTMELQLTFDGTQHRVEMRRGDADRQMIREVRLPAGGEIEVKLIPGVTSPTGHAVWADVGLVERRTVRPVPAPKFEAHARPPMMDGAWTVVVDPEAVRQQRILDQLRREEERLALRRRRIVRSVVAVLGCLVLGSVGTWWFAIRAVPAYQLTASIQPVVRLTPTSVQLAWDPLLDQIGNPPLSQYVVMVPESSGTLELRDFGPSGESGFNPAPGDYRFDMSPYFEEDVDWVGEFIAPTLSFQRDPTSAASALLSEETTLVLDTNQATLDIIIPEVVAVRNDVSFIVRWQERGTDLLLTDFVDQQGRYELGVLPAGTWDVSVRVRSNGRLLPEYDFPAFTIPPNTP